MENGTGSELETSLSGSSKKALPRALWAWLRTEPAVRWIGAVSFEERCVASAARLNEAGVQVFDAILLDYPSEVRQQGESTRRRDLHRSLIRTSLGIDGTAITVDPYAYMEMTAVLQALDPSAGSTTVVVDLSCLTKIHTMALASWIARESANWNVVLAYTVPENYLSLARIGDGWKDLLVVPVDGTAGLLNESHSRGLIILGHENDRLAVSLAEIEPSGGSVVIARSEDRPDWCSLSERRNAKLIDSLVELPRSRWSRSYVALDEWRKTAAIAEREATMAKEKGSSVFLFPFGPKPILMACAIELVRSFAEGSWFVYPVPSSYDVNYSDGTADTRWYSLVSIPQVLPSTAE